MMGGQQKITNNQNEILASNYLVLSDWTLNILASVKSLILLDLVRYIYEAAKNIIRESLLIYTDYLKGTRFLNIEMKKISDYTTLRSLSLYEVDRLIKILKYKVSIEYSRGHPK